MNIGNIPNLIPFALKGPIDVASATMSYEVHGYIEDRYAGITVTEEIWSGVNVNSAHISRLLSNDTVRLEVQKFFTARTLRSLFPIWAGSDAMWRVGGYRVLINKVHSAVLKAVGNEDTAAVIVEIIMPSLASNHITREPAMTTKIMNRFTYPFNADPTVADLATETSRQSLERAIVDCVKSWSVKSGQTYAVSAVAEDFANAFFPIGRALRAMYDFQIVFADLVKVCRARLDPELVDMRGSIPNSILNHPVVDSVITNWTFIREALAIPRDESISTDNSEFAFDKWAGDALAMLKESPRYAFRSRRDALHNLGIVHLNDLTGIRRAAIVYEHAEMAAAALSVIAIDDDVLPKAKNIDKSTGRIDAHLAAAYGSLPQSFSVKTSVQALTDIAAHFLEAQAPDECGRTANMGVFLHVVREYSLPHIAMMLADRIMCDPLDSGSLIYAVNTTARVELASGVVIHNYAYTSDPAEVILLANSIDSPVKSDTLPQLLPRAALGSHLFTSAKQDIFIRSAARFPFSQIVGAVTIRGSIRMVELETSRADLDASLVFPAYNDHVFRTARGAFESAYALIQELGEEAPLFTRRRLKDMYVQSLVNACRGVSPAFRRSIQKLLAQKTLKNVLQPDVRLMTAQLNREAVRAFSDSFASAFFLAIQGIGLGSAVSADSGIRIIDEAEQKVDALDTFFTDIWKDEELVTALIEFGSDRKDE